LFSVAAEDNLDFARSGWHLIFNYFLTIFNSGLPSRGRNGTPNDRKAGRHPLYLSFNDRKRRRGVYGNHSARLKEEGKVQKSFYNQKPFLFHFSKINKTSKTL
jgi:hypothetical protein